MVLRFYKRPAKTRSTTIIQAFSTLPLVVLMHFIIAFLTLGDSTVFVSNKIFNFESNMQPNAVFLGHETLLLFMNGADREHMLPALVALAIVLACIVLYLFPTSPLFQLVKCVRVLLGKRTRRVSENNPPFTSVYIKPVLKRHWEKMEGWTSKLLNCCKYVVMSSMVGGEEEDTRLALSLSEQMNGWVIKEEKTTGGKFKMKEWRTNGYDSQGRIQYIVFFV